MILYTVLKYAHKLGAISYFEFALISIYFYFRCFLLAFQLFIKLIRIRHKGQTEKYVINLLTVGQLLDIFNSTKILKKVNNIRVMMVLLDNFKQI